MTLAVHVERSTLVTAIGLAVVTAYFAVLTWAVEHWAYEQWVVIVLAPLLLAIGTLIIVVVTRRDENPLTRLLVVALIVKLVASFVRYYVSFSLYGSGDALRYDAAGTEIANSFHRADISIVDLLTFRQGTLFVEDFTGFLYSLAGPSRLGGFLLYSWLGFWGLFLFHRAARIGVPNADQRRYALLVCFLPSLVFWPSSIGKEALMLLSLGCSAYGAARILERYRGGWLALAAGLGLAWMVRPHVGVVVLAALVIAVLFRRRPGHRPIFGPVGRVVTVALLVAVLAFGLGRAVDRLLPLRSESTGVEAVQEVLDRAETGTDEGGSQIDRPSPNSPVEYPSAVFSVLFRPTIFEAHTSGTTVAALETTLILALLLVGWRQVRTAFRSAFRQTYILFCIVYTAIFTLAWSSFANLGALARQRVQVWPFVLILLALPAALREQPAAVGGADRGRSSSVLARR
jgi:hypothetical protein